MTFSCLLPELHRHVQWQLLLTLQVLPSPWQINPGQYFFTLQTTCRGCEFVSEVISSSLYKLRFSLTQGASILPALLKDSWDGAQPLYWCFSLVPIGFQLLPLRDTRQCYTCTLTTNSSLNIFQVLILAQHQNILLILNSVLIPFLTPKQNWDRNTVVPKQNLHSLPLPLEISVFFQFLAASWAFPSQNYQVIQEEWKNQTDLCITSPCCHYNVNSLKGADCACFNSTGWLTGTSSVLCSPLQVVIPRAREESSRRGSLVISLCVNE